MLTMLYCMAIVRLVNGVVEKTRKKTEVSIAKAADAINIPRMLIDIRHEGSHPDLPSLRLVRLASIKVCICSLSVIYNLIKLSSLGGLFAMISYKVFEHAKWFEALC
ncbi:ribosomal biogenesis protein LAS1L-like [Camellia sinensis]|uniref:ribosomal biogenesis protein LAS1L-like n=1 Tax=Camellia sinensis TaxID=4442 RepID=UPI001036E58E|nr:ribosomal biogenesis protein LAS1L-like [Camellia sinensis]